MDPFKLLTQGTHFSKKSNKNNQVQALFKSTQSATSANPTATSDSSVPPTSHALPAALDFFNVGADAGTGQNESASDGKKRKREEKPMRAVAPRILPTPTHRVNLTGRAAPTPLASLEEFVELHSPPPYIIRNLAEMGITEMSEVGRGAGSVIMAGRDLTALAPTGSGKTISYLLPLLTLLRQPASSLKSESKASTSSSSSSTSKSPRALIVSPTRELALQIQNECAKLTKGRKWRTVVLSKANQDTVVNGDIDILICTPQRLMQTIKDKSLSLESTTHLIMDEADRLLDSTFLPIMDEILSHLTSAELKRYLFTATLPSTLEEIARGLGKGDGIRLVVGIKDAVTSKISQKLIYTATENGKLHALRSLLKAGSLPPPCLIFVQSIQRANDLFHELVYDGFALDVIHSERTPEQRDKVVREFREGKVWVLICTELMGRGMDFRGVEVVVNYDFPAGVQSYVHRIGRTGRAGRDGQAITFFNNEDGANLKMIANVMRQSGCEVPEWMLALKNPSKKDRRKLQKKPTDRMEVRTAAGSGLGRQKATKRREMVEGSKRRKTKGDQESGDDE
ncbi:p-loop containing nucleoside triphosphate hydrolase protein [Phaffia rhodozyma]|uniref:RNA helicase n=1 Tax=Phaffia rhodozyma TaxID=264483 RepID=A0A0F7SQ83_PHARH|nr:p-loop containing nucleoside triphosphate hydrolase protein [Phaffia rhodozyma]